MTRFAKTRPNCAFYDPVRPTPKRLSPHCFSASLFDSRNRNEHILRIWMLLEAIAPSSPGVHPRTRQRNRGLLPWLGSSTCQPFGGLRLHQRHVTTDVCSPHIQFSKTSTHVRAADGPICWLPSFFPTDDRLHDRQPTSVLPSRGRAFSSLGHDQGDTSDAPSPIPFSSRNSSGDQPSPLTIRTRVNRNPDIHRQGRLPSPSPPRGMGSTDGLATTSDYPHHPSPPSLLGS